MMMGWRRIAVALHRSASCLAVFVLYSSGGWGASSDSVEVQKNWLANGTNRLHATNLFGTIRTVSSKRASLPKHSMCESLRRRLAQRNRYVSLARRISRPVG